MLAVTRTAEESQVRPRARGRQRDSEAARGSRGGTPLRRGHIKMRPKFRTSSRPSEGPQLAVAAREGVPPRRPPTHLKDPPLDSGLGADVGSAQDGPMSELA